MQNLTAGGSRGRKSLHSYLTLPCLQCNTVLILGARRPIGSWIVIWRVDLLFKPPPPAFCLGTSVYPVVQGDHRRLEESLPRGGRWCLECLQPPLPGGSRTRLTQVLPTTDELCDSGQKLHLVPYL